MDCFDDQPREGDPSQNFRIVRTPATGEIKGLILSSKHQGATTHYWKGRTIPCTGPTDEACAAGHEPRWHGHLLVYGEKSGEVILFEYPDKSHATIKAYLERHLTLRGARILARRIGGKPNGRVHLALIESARDPESLPPETPIKPILMRMWEMTEQSHIDFTQPLQSSQAPKKLFTNFINSQPNIRATLQHNEKDNRNGHSDTYRSEQK
jgi:hypothetical protein